MLAVKLHKTVRPQLRKDAFLVPIVDWKSGSRQVKNWLRWRGDRDRYMTLVRVPEDHPVSIRFSYRESNFIKAFAWPREFKPLREWDKEYVKAIGKWWDAYRLPSGACEEGGLLVDEPRLFLGLKLPDSCVLWTKEIALLYGRKRSRP
jgi:hypothetical protein